MHPIKQYKMYSSKFYEKFKQNSDVEAKLAYFFIMNGF